MGRIAIFKKVTTILMFIVLCGVLVACNNSDTDANKKEISVLLTDNPYTQELKNLANEFEKETGIKANVEVVGQDVSEKRTQITFTGKTDDIDVVYMPGIFMEKWVKAGWVLGLDDLINSDEDINLDDFIQSTIESMKVKDEIYGLPSMAETVILAYRKDVFNESGIIDIPETWGELEEVSKKIQTDKMAAITMRGKRGQGMNMFVFPMFMWSHGGKYFENYPEDMTLTVNTSENISALETYINLMDNYGPAGGSNYAVSDLLATMTQGKAAIAIDGTSVVGQLLDNDFNQYSDEIGFAVVPGGDNHPPTPGSAVHGLAISNFSKKPDESYEFIKWATSAEIQKKLALNSAYSDFTRKSVSEDSDVLKKYNAEMMQVRAESLELGRPDYRPLIPEWNEIGDTFGARVNEALNGGISAEEAMNRAQKEIKEIMDKAGY